MIGLGTAAQSTAAPQRKRRRPPSLAWLWGFRRRRVWPSLGRGSPIPGPYRVVAGKLYVAGAVAGTVEVAP